ncbi:hypothetical protein DID77_00405 [Candidatus Marinamargulisbacteria bacterium SCGC AG-439-L15]|nr:hypothetical protein DID77_00405 [Candidatus Marinamargulisbacteria bacterium SCGC AG-439-L15]
MWNGIKSTSRVASFRLLFITLALLGLSLLSFVVFTPYIPYNIKLNVDDIAIETIVSPRFIEIQTAEDRLKTEELRKQRGSLVKPVYAINEDINKMVRSAIVNFFTKMRQFRTEKLKNPETPIPPELKFIPKRTLVIITTLDAKTFASLEYITLQNNENILSQGLKKINKRKIKTQVMSNVKMLGLGKTAESFIVHIITHFILPNVVPDEAKTQALIQRELDSINPFTTTFKEGEPIIYKGEKVNQKHIEILTALNLYGVKANLMKYFGIFLYGALLFILFERFLYYFTPKYHKSIPLYLATFLLASAVIIIARLLVDIKDLQYVTSLRFFIPIPIVAMSISVLASTTIAMVAGTITAILIAVMYQADFYLLLFLFLSTCVATFSSYKIFKRTELISAGNIVGLFNCIIIIAIGFLLEVNDIAWYISNGLLGFGNGLLSAMLTFAVLPYLENLFKITTSLTLLEQANLNHPLLKKLMVTAPGTYQHSLMVANLAEAAAESINADAILTRIGAYFHDIGKMKRPLFFSENQQSGENPHDALNPRMSKIIIAAHPKDGVEIGLKNKLPKVLLDFMLEHHGTTLVSFFYSQVLQEENTTGSASMKDEFRYPGPKPQSKESGIVMLADSLEAAVRALEKPTPTKIENLVEKIFKERIEDKQLVESGLTLNEIETIQQTFLDLFKGIYHSRLDYQEEIAQIIEQTKR